MVRFLCRYNCRWYILVVGSRIQLRNIFFKNTLVSLLVKFERRWLKVWLNVRNLTNKICGRSLIVRLKFLASTKISLPKDEVPRWINALRFSCKQGGQHDPNTYDRTIYRTYIYRRRSDSCSDCGLTFTSVSWMRSCAIYELHFKFSRCMQVFLRRMISQARMYAGMP